MKFKINDLVTYGTNNNVSCFRIVKVFPNFRQKQMKGYSIRAEDPKSCFNGKHFASVKEESLKPYAHPYNQFKKQYSVMNKEQTASWIDGIISDLTDKNVTLEDCLRKTLVLAFTLKNNSLKAWVESELNGYTSEESVPEYRIVGLEVMANLAQHVPGGILKRTESLHFQASDHAYFIDLREGLRLTSTVAALESVTRPRGVEGIAALTFPVNRYAAYSLQELQPAWVIEKAWIQISEITITSVLSQIKTKLLQFLLTLSDELGTDAKYSIMEKSEKITRIFEDTIRRVHIETANFGTSYITKGSNNNIVQGNQNSQHVNSPKQTIDDIQQLIERIKKALKESNDIEPETKEEVGIQVTTIERQMGKANPNLTVVGKSVQLIESFLMDAATSEYTPLILQGIKNLLPQLA